MGGLTNAREWTERELINHLDAVCTVVVFYCQNEKLIVLSIMISGVVLGRSSVTSALLRCQPRLLTGSTYKPLNGATCENSTSDASPARSVEWRKQQLDRLEKKLSTEEPAQSVESDVEVQPMWKEMESRVTNRRPLTAAQRGGRVGRKNVRTTDEEIWLKEGLYDDNANGAK